ncbi:MAG TPA: acetyl-CoA carboxylase carboxyltransferase subunit alpha [Candidatus Krumholzibacteria bacterium]|nr:acetyl-CoA carboxylase carboxyltransferase subunit alpha [Candidatus Krumholzibacteria bacterium]
MNRDFLEFERPILELETKISELRDLAATKGMDVVRELESLEKQADRLREEIYSNLSAWQRVQLARHPRRPYTLDYLRLVCDEFTELHGDRLFGDDRAIVGGMALLCGRQVMVIGHQKGRDTKENLLRNFGMPHPEGYRKALRLMQMAGKFGRPIVTFIDTPGAYPGVDAEKRGQFEAIARNLREMVRIPVPIVVVIIGEGGSGGALAMAVGDRVLMLENSIYSVISPEGCAAILWGDRAQAPRAAEALRLTARDLAQQHLIDRVVDEPKGGAHRDPEAMAVILRQVLADELASLDPVPAAARLEVRFQKYLAMGVFSDTEAVA